MVESLENKVNIEILKIDDIVTEIIIRGEWVNKSIGISIDCIIYKNYENIYENIKNLRLEEVKKYLKEENIEYKKVEFI